MIAMVSVAMTQTVSHVLILAVRAMRQHVNFARRIFSNAAEDLCSWRQTDRGAQG
jgi:hypothetical protein